jgi:hypothetical protein
LVGGLVDDDYEDGSGSEHGIYQAHKLALYQNALQRLSNTYYYGEEENLFRLRVRTAGFHTG